MRVKCRYSPTRESMSMMDGWAGYKGKICLNAHGTVDDDWTFDGQKVQSSTPATHYYLKYPGVVYYTLPYNNGWHGLSICCRTYLSKLLHRRNPTVSKIR